MNNVYFDILSNFSGSLQSRDTGDRLDFKAAVDKQASQTPQTAEAPVSAPIPQEYAEIIPENASASLSPEPMQAQVINVNSCTAEELIALPGISIAAANKAVSLRRENPYASADDFIQRNQIKPHFALQILPKIKAEPVAAKPSGTVRRRGLDI